jgi:hypothetical protein
MTLRNGYVFLEMYFPHYHITLSYEVLHSLLFMSSYKYSVTTHLYIDISGRRTLTGRCSFLLFWPVFIAVCLLYSVADWMRWGHILLTSSNIAASLRTKQSDINNLQSFITLEIIILVLLGNRVRCDRGTQSENDPSLQPAWWRWNKYVGAVNWG